MRIFRRTHWTAFATITGGDKAQKLLFQMEVVYCVIIVEGMRFK